MDTATIIQARNRVVMHHSYSIPEFPCNLHHSFEQPSFHMMFGNYVRELTLIQKIDIGY